MLAVTALSACEMDGRPDRPSAAGDIGGVVAGPNGPEADVWVIAETGDLPTNFVRIVVTDDEGRFLVPDLPAADYDVWVGATASSIRRRLVRRRAVRSI
jgi:hypothetical protein